MVQMDMLILDAFSELEIVQDPVHMDIPGVRNNVGLEKDLGIAVHVRGAHRQRGSHVGRVLLQVRTKHEPIHLDDIGSILETDKDRSQGGGYTKHKLIEIEDGKPSCLGRDILLGIQ